MIVVGFWGEKRATRVKMLARGFLEDTRRDELWAVQNLGRSHPEGSRERQGENELIGFLCFALT